MKTKIGTVLVGVCVLSASAGVWNDAILRIRGAVDRNNDGLWTATDYTSANCEIPDVMRAAETAPTSTKIIYNMTAHADSNVRIVNREVKLGSEGRTVTRPVLYFPQPWFVDGTVNKARLQCFKLFNGGTPPITTNQWSAVFRLKPDIYTLQKSGNGSSWFFQFPCRTGTRPEMRLGIRTKNQGASGFVNLCAGNSTNNEFTDLLLTNDCDWAEISLTVSGTVVRVSCGQPGRLRRWRTYDVSGLGASGPAGPFVPSIFRLGDCSRAATESCDGGNADGFRGYIETVGIWDRVLSDAEVSEAFGGPSPALFRIGEEGASQRMFAGAKATGTVTLDPDVNDQRLWPASFGVGARIDIPFTVDTYRANLANALRFVPREGSAYAKFAVSLDGTSIGFMPVYARKAGEAARPSFRFVNSGQLTQGSHVLSLTCVSAHGDVLPDTIELGGSWCVGNGTTGPVSYDSDTAYGNASQRAWADTYYVASQNMKDFAYFVGAYGDTRRDKRIFWDIPSGLAGRAKFQLTYKIQGLSPAALETGRHLVTSVNGESVDTVQSASMTRTIDVPAGQLHDGLNEITLGFDTLAQSLWGNIVLFRVEMTECEEDKDRGAVIIIR